MTATTKIIMQMFDKAEASLARSRDLFVLVYDHAHRNDSPPGHSAEVVNAERLIRPERAPEPLDKRTLRFVHDTLCNLAQIEQMLASRLPALEAQLRGKKLSPEAPLGSRASVESPCIVCEQVVAQLRRGMCWSDYQAYRRAGFPDVGTWIPKRRLELA